MSYRVRVGDTQIFGNNECYEEWDDFIKSQGVDIDEEGCYDGYIKDVNRGLNVIEDIVMKKGIKIADLKSMVEVTFEHPDEFCLTDDLFIILHNSYLFMPYIYFQACMENGAESVDIVDDPKQRFYGLKLKAGVEGIHVHAG